MLQFAMSTVSMSVCITLTIAVLVHAALNSGTPMSQPCLIYSGVVAAASSAAVMGLALVARLSVAQTLTLTMAFAVVLALVWEYAGFDARVAATCWAARTTGVSGERQQTGTVHAAAWLPSSVSVAEEVAEACAADESVATGDLAAGIPDLTGESNARALLDLARLSEISPAECELLVRAEREGADLGEVDMALAVLMKLLIHPALVRDSDLRRDLVDYQRRLHARHAVLSMRASGPGGDIGQSAVRAQAQARLARLYSSLEGEYSDGSGI